MIKIKELRIGNKVSVNKGFEMEVIYMPQPNWIIGGNYS